MIQLHCGDCLDVLREMPSGTVQCAVTSPPYFGLRDYGVSGQVGLEKSPDEYVARLVEVFREVRRVLKDDGTLWLNIGDSYARPPAKGGSGPGGKNRDWYGDNYGQARGAEVPAGLKAKDLLMIPARVALALQADGWYLRSEIVWAKPNPMPESVRDRPTSAHEKVFLLAKAPRYYYDADAVREEYKRSSAERLAYSAQGTAPNARFPGGDIDRRERERRIRPPNPLGRNMRNVWEISPIPFKGAHFATFPPKLAERCILAGSRPGDMVLDPFAGAGTVALVAAGLSRHAIGIEINPAYLALARDRLGLFAPALAAE